MNKKILKSILTTFVIISIFFCFTGCTNSNNEKNNSQKISSDNNDTHLINVLKGKEMYRYSSEEYDGIIYSEDINVGSQFYIDDTPYLSTEKISSLIQSYALVDINGDSKNELIAEINYSNGFILILHRENDINYGYILSIKTFNTVKENGTFLSSSSTDNTTIHQAEFVDEMLNIKTIAYSSNNQYYNGNDEIISESEFNQLFDEFQKNKDVTYIKLN